MWWTAKRDRLSDYFLNVIKDIRLSGFATLFGRLFHDTVYRPEAVLMPNQQ